MRIYKLTFKEQQQIVNGKIQNHKNCKVTLPIDIVNELGLSKDNNLCSISVEDGKIVITPVSKIELVKWKGGCCRLILF